MPRPVKTIATPLADTFVAAYNAAQDAEERWTECDCESCRAHVRSRAAGFSIDYDHETCPQYHASVAADEARDRARSRWLTSDEPRTYRISDGNAMDLVTAAPDTIENVVAEWLTDGAWDREQTLFLTAYARLIDPATGDATDDDSVSAAVVLDAEPPRCSPNPRADHDWWSPHSVVGGDKRNPGVFGSGGGVKTTEVCARCGVYKTTDTWATNPNDGTQGHTVVEYRERDDASAAWLEQIGELVAGPEEIEA